MIRTPRKGLLLVSLIAAGVFAGGAVAFWTTTGNGDAAATVANPDPVTFAAGTPTGALYPGTSADVAVEITNPNPFRVNIPSLVLDTSQGDGGFGVDGSHTACELSALTYQTQDNGGSGWLVPGTNAPSNELSLDLPDAIALDTTAANECQGATFTIYLQVGS